MNNNFTFIVKLLSHVLLFATPWTVAHQAPLSIEFSRQEYWSGLLFPSPGDLPDPGIEPRSPTLQADTLTSELPGKPNFTCIGLYNLKSWLTWQCQWKVDKKNTIHCYESISWGDIGNEVKNEKNLCSVNYCKKKKALVHVQKELCPLVYMVIFLHNYEYTLK